MVSENVWEGRTLGTIGVKDVDAGIDFIHDSENCTLNCSYANNKSALHTIIYVEPIIG